MNSHKKYEEAQKGKVSNDWNPLCFSCHVARSSVGADGGRVSSRTRDRGRRPRLQNSLICPANMLSSVGADGGRARRESKSSSKKGAAIVELALAMLLMMSMIAFSVFVCRALSERNRSLAASRTVAWLYSHADDPDGKDDVRRDDVATSLSAWHFKPSTRVNVDIKTGSGLIATETASNAVSAVQNESDDHKDHQLASDSTIHVLWFSIPSPMTFVTDCFDKFIVCAVNFLTKDFAFCEATVTSSTPLIFGPGFYQMFDWFQGLDSNTKSVMLKPSFCSSCVMPMQSGGDGVKGPFDSLIEELKQVTEWLQALVDDAQKSAIYRPYDYSLPTPAIDPNALYALLIFEIDEPSHAPLKQGSSAAWEGGTVTFTPANQVNSWLDRCKYGE